jgi:hypothetical protein
VCIVLGVCDVRVGVCCVYCVYVVCMVHVLCWGDVIDCVLSCRDTTAHLLYVVNVCYHYANGVCYSRYSVIACAR